MPGTGIIGLRSADPSAAHKQRPTSQSPQVRNLARLLKLLQDPETAVAALLDAVKQSSLSQRTSLMHSHLQSLLDLLRRKGWQNFKSHASLEMAQAAEAAFVAATRDNLGESNEMLADARQEETRRNRFPRDSLLLGAHATEASSVKETQGLHPPAMDPITTAAATEKPVTDSLALVSDTEDAASGYATAKPGYGIEDDVDLDSEFALMDFWSNLLEAVHLQVSSRTTRVWGRRKIYEVYRLAGPTTPVSDLDQLRHKISKQFLAIYEARDRRMRQYGNCRVFAVQHADALWIQFNIGRAFDCNDEMNRSARTGGKKGKLGTEYLAIVHSESNLVALTASRAPSRAPFTSYVLSALETVLTCSVAGGYALERKLLSVGHSLAKILLVSREIVCVFQMTKQLDFFLTTGTSAKRIRDLSGTQPFELLRAAKVIEAGDALGRYASYAAAGAASDPIVDLQNAATTNLLATRDKEESLLQMSDEMTAVASQVAQQTDKSARVLAANNLGLCIDHSRNKRSGEFGDDGDCPRRRCVRWDWKGLTSAPAAGWLGDKGQQLDDLPKEIFKCRIVMKGSDVFGGIKALMENGLVQAPLPHYVQDAPLLGDKICVDRDACVNCSDGSCDA